MFVWSYHPTRSGTPVGQSWWDGELTTSTDAHSHHSLIPARNNLATSEFETEGLTAVPGGIELATRVPGHSDVMHLGDVTRLGLVTVAADDVNYAQLFASRLTFGDVYLGLFAHASSVSGN